MATIFVGDIHGCAEEFEDLLAAVDHQISRDRLLLTGDLFSRGPDPLGVWRAVQRTGAEIVLGNHDVHLRGQLQAIRARTQPTVDRDDEQRVLDALSPVHAEVLAWLEALPYFIQEPEFLLVHAGVHPTLGLAGTSRKMLYTLRLWPPAKGIVGPRWHESYDAPPDAPPIVFGHDAPGGLVIRRRPDGSPTLIGLDSGCIYGGPLSAWFLEADRIVQVPSRQPGEG